MPAIALVVVVEAVIAWKNRPWFSRGISLVISLLKARRFKLPDETLSDLVVFPRRRTEIVWRTKIRVWLPSHCGIAAFRLLEKNTYP